VAIDELASVMDTYMDTIIDDFGVLCLLYAVVLSAVSPKTTNHSTHPLVFKRLKCFYNLLLFVFSNITSTTGTYITSTTGTFDCELSHILSCMYIGIGLLIFPWYSTQYVGT